MVGASFIALHHTPCPPRLEATRADDYTARMTDAAKHRRWLRYSLITLLVLVVIAGVTMTWIGRTMRAWAQRTEVVEAIANAGGRVRLDFQIDESGNRIAEARPHASTWFRSLTNDNLGGNAVEAEVPTNDALEDIDILPNLRILDLISSGITDACLPHLEHLSQLESLHLHETKLTEQGILKIQKALPNCKIVR
jgi:Leucine-rich repeat (LRR) protein